MIISVLAFVFVLGVAINLHEFGHFIIAKLLGIRVEAYSFFGLGPRLFGFRVGHTDYRVSAIPLGAYVKLYGDESTAGLEGKDAAGEQVPDSELFELRPRWQKFLVAVAGPVMNILTALAIPFAVALWSGVPSNPAPVVSYVKANGAAQKAGLQPGDRIVNFAGEANPTWSDIEQRALLSPNQTIPLVAERGGQRISLNIVPTAIKDGDQTLGSLEFAPDPGSEAVIIGAVSPNSPAAEAGLQPGDRILSVGGQPARNSMQVKQFIASHPEESFNLTVERKSASGQTETKEITARTRKLEDNSIRLGVEFQPPPLEHAGVGRAFNYAVEQNVNFIKMTGLAIGQIFQGKRSARDTLSGPIGIAQETARAANEFGWSGVISILALISLNLGLVNLLPIPVLDGGMIFLLGVEAVLGWVGLKLSNAMRERIQLGGLVIVAALMIFVITNDLLRMASKWRSNPPAATQQK